MPGAAIVIGSPVGVGHVRPLIPVARRFVERGDLVVWAISGDANEPASAWAEPLNALGVRFVDLDAIAPFSRGTLEEFGGANFLSLFRRILARANDVAAIASSAIAAAVGDLPIAAGIYDFFAVWAYVAFRRLGVVEVASVLSAFPGVLDTMPNDYQSDPVYHRELERLRSEGFGAFGEVPRAGLIPQDQALRVFAFSSPRLCTKPPIGIALMGLVKEALPRVDAAAPEATMVLVDRLQRARAAGAPVLLLSLGTVVTRMFSRMSPAHTSFLRRLYSTLAASALRCGAVVVASTCDSSAAELGVDEATLGPAAAEHVIAMPFVPQPHLFAHGLVDLMLSHGGANTFYETVVSGIPLLVCPGFGDQASVSLAVLELGIGACVESIGFPDLPGAISIERVADELMPAMLSPGNRWKLAMARLAAEVQREDGLGALEALLTKGARPVDAHAD